jgi:hypothetical protein
MKSIVIAAATAFACILGIQGASATTQNVNNVNDPVNHPYQENNVSTCGTSDCIVTFGTITASEAVVQHVSCGFYTATNTAVTLASVYDGKSGDANYLPVSSYGSNNGYFTSAINENTQLFLTTGATRTVEVTATGTLNNLVCTISGYHR